MPAQFNDTSQDSINPGISIQPGFQQFLQRGSKLVDNTVIMVFANFGYMDMLLNTLDTIQKSCPNHEVSVFVLDSSTQEALDGMGIESYLFKSRFHPPEQDLNIWSNQWKNVVLNKLEILQSVLRLGHRVLYTDIDIVWLKNPFPFIRDFLSEECDLLIQTEQDMMCSGFLYAKPCRGTIELFDTRKEDIHLFPTQKDSRVDQPLLDRRIKMSKGLRYCVFPVDLFPVGHEWYRNWKILQHKAYIVHFNGVCGKRKKIYKMRRYGHWAMDKSSSSLFRTIKLVISYLY
jgi:hypothetical protein